MNVGDLVIVTEERACGGVPNGAIGLVLEEDKRQPMSFKWKIMWLAGNEVMSGLQMKESVTYGHGVEVISENR